MNARTTIAVLAGLLVFLLLVTAIGVHLFLLKSDNSPDAFIGVDVGYGNATDVYNIADAVTGYANLIIIGSLEITSNTTALTNVCDYLYQKGFYFIVYVGFAKKGVFPPQGPDPLFFQMAENRWGSKFLGAYMFDEPGGKQLDLPKNSPDRPAPTARSYTDAAVHFILDVGSYLSLYQEVYYGVPQLKLFTSDYALYWYDYLSGYNVVFSELLGSPTDQLAISLNRGAAECQNKDWGAILTFGPSNDSSSHIPAFENVTQFYNEMILAWQNNAKYIIVFDAPGANHQATTPDGILTNEHLNAMKNFWTYAQEHKRPQIDPAQTAYVLPRDYGYEFSGPSSTIWGVFPPDNLSSTIWTDTNNLLANYGMKLDIVYETRTDNIPIYLPYKTLIFWNGTIINT
jgi:hypothetical protein